MMEAGGSSPATLLCSIASKRSGNVRSRLHPSYNDINYSQVRKGSLLFRVRFTSEQGTDLSDSKVPQINVLFLEDSQENQETGLLRVDIHGCRSCVFL